MEGSKSRFPDIQKCAPRGRHSCPPQPFAVRAARHMRSLRGNEARSELHIACVQWMVALTHFGGACTKPQAIRTAVLIALCEHFT